MEEPYPDYSSGGGESRRGGGLSQRTGAPGRIRTCGLWFRRPALYPLSYRRTGCQLDAVYCITVSGSCPNLASLGKLRIQPFPPHDVERRAEDPYTLPTSEEVPAPCPEAFSRQSPFSGKCEFGFGSSMPRTQGNQFDHGIPGAGYRGCKGCIDGDILEAIFRKRSSPLGGTEAICFPECYSSKGYPDRECKDVRRQRREGSMSAGNLAGC